MAKSLKLYKDAERLIEDFFQNFELHIAPRATCDEVAVQRVKETLANYLEFTGGNSAELDRSELESVFRAALTDFLYEVYFTLDDEPEGRGDPDSDPFSEAELEEELRAMEAEVAAAEADAESGGEDDDGDDPEDDRELYAILTLEEIVTLLHDAPEAHSDCECLAQKAKQAAEAHGTRGVVATLEGLVDALRAHKLTTEVRKVLADGYFALGEVHGAAGEGARAIASYKQAARVHGHFPEAHARLAAAYVEADDLPSALDAWRQQLTLTPDDPEPYLAAAQACEAHGRPERAIEFLGAMQGVDGDNAVALDMLVRICEEEGQLPEAQGWRERLLNMRPPRRIEDLSLWVKHQVEAGHFDTVLQHLHKEELDAPALSVLNLLKAMVFLAKKDPDNAEVELLLLREKYDGSAELEGQLLGFERIFGELRVASLRRAIVEHGV